MVTARALLICCTVKRARRAKARNCLPGEGQDLSYDEGALQCTLSRKCELGSVKDVPEFVPGRKARDHG